MNYKEEYLKLEKFLKYRRLFSGNVGNYYIDVIGAL